MTVQEFTKTRLGFAIVNGKLIFQSDRTSTIPWMKGELELSDAEIESTIRGGIFEDRISLCVGSEYACADLSEIPMDIFVELLLKHEELYPRVAFDVFNGQIKGEAGVDWAQKEHVITIGYAVKGA